jgi:hypothetical protein
MSLRVLPTVFFLAWISLLILSLAGVPRLSPESSLLSLLGPVLAAIGLAVGVRTFFRGFRLLERKRRMENTPTSTVRAAALGLVEVCGNVVGPYTLIAPLSEAECYYYHAVVWGTPENGEDSDQPQAREEVLCAPFFIDDGTGQLMVDPRGAEIDLPLDFDEQCSAETMPDAWSLFLERRGILTASSCRLQERSIKPGDTLYVLGTLAERSRNEYLADRPPGSPAGILSREAAALQRLEVLEAMKVPVRDISPPSSVATTEFDLEPRVLLRKSRGEPFFISRHSQRELLVNLAANSTIYIWGGPLMAIISLGVLLHWLGSL